MHRNVACVVIIVPLVGGIATLISAVLLVMALLSLDPDGLGPTPLDQVDWGWLARISLPFLLIGTVSTTLGLINLVRSRTAK